MSIHLVKRRDFIAALVGTAVWPIVARAQNIPRIGVLRVAGPPSQPSHQDLVEGLRDLGYVDSHNIIIEFRSAEGRVESLVELAAELVRLNVSVIVAYGPQTIQAAMAATKKIPIVMGRMDDADAHGFVTNFARPAGNVTGMSFPSGELRTKWLEFLKELLPPGAKIAALWDSAGTSHQLQLTEQAARKVGVALSILPIRGAQDLSDAFATANREKAQGLIVLGSPVMTSMMETLAKRALENRLAATYAYREFTQAGGLLSYGPLETDPHFAFRHAADFVDRILRGAKPEDLPVEQPTYYVLTVSLKTAKTLGLTIPATLLGRDEVFE
jgi:putative tryptophan/tyrosine transport system substrate-binding protein